MSIHGCAKGWTPDHALAANGGPSVAEQIEAERERHDADPENPDGAQARAEREAEAEATAAPEVSARRKGGAKKGAPAA